MTINIKSITWCICVLFVLFFLANRPVKAWWKIDIASGSCRWKSDAGAVRQVTGWQCQNEASDGSDIRAFNR